MVGVFLGVLGALGVGTVVFLLLVFRFSSERTGFIAGASAWVLGTVFHARFSEPSWVWVVVFGVCWACVALFVLWYITSASIDP